METVGAKYQGAQKVVENPGKNWLFSLEKN